MADVAPIFELIHHARRRLRMQRVLERLCIAAIPATAVALIGVHVVREATLPGLAILGAAIAIVAVATLRAALRRIHDDDIAHLLDRATDLDDRLRVAIIFERSVDREPCAETAGFMHLAIDDGVRAVDRVDVIRATPYREPAHAKLAIGVLVVAALVALVDTPAEPSESDVALAFFDDDDATTFDVARYEAEPEWQLDGAREEAANIRAIGEREHLQAMIDYADLVTAMLNNLEANRIDKLQLLEGLAGAERKVRADLAGGGGGGLDGALDGLDDLHEAIARLDQRPTPQVAVHPVPPPRHPEPPGNPLAPPPPLGPNEPGQPGPSTTAPAQPGPKVSNSNNPGQKPGDQGDKGDKGDKADKGIGHLPGNEHAEPGLQTLSRGGQPTVDVAVPGVAGRGTSRRETIESVAQHGTASEPYKKVYAEYRARAEETMHAEKVPASYRYFIKQYFRRIHPK